jgi:hypothetical protein
MKVYLFNNKPFLSIEKLVNEMIKLNLKYCNSVRDCYEHVVYLPCIDIDNELENDTDMTTVSFGCITLNDETFLFTNKQNYDDFIYDNFDDILNNTWYDKIIVI